MWESRERTIVMIVVLVMVGSETSV
jgi:hypothetical protein